MKNQPNTGEKMLAQMLIEESREKQVLTGLVELNHGDVLAGMRQINAKMTRALLSSPDTYNPSSLEEVPVTINLSRFCALMSPYICMN